MTTHRQCRCAHCLVLYSYQGSGPDAPEYNDSRYCESCQRVVIAALSQVPRKFEKVWISTDKVTIKQLKKWEVETEKEMAQARSEGKIVGRRVGVPLYRIHDGPNGPVVGDAQKVCFVKGRGSFVGSFYEYRHWPDEPDKVEIRTRVERDLSDGSTKPWREVEWSGVV
jgi:hypothetical protein